MFDFLCLVPLDLLSESWDLWGHIIVLFFMFMFMFLMSRVEVKWVFLLLGSVFQWCVIGFIGPQILFTPQHVQLNWVWPCHCVAWKEFLLVITPAGLTIHWSCVWGPVFTLLPFISASCSLIYCYWHLVCDREKGREKEEDGTKGVSIIGGQADRNINR